MAYINTETNEIGTLYQLLPNVSSPIRFSEEELLALNIEKYTPPVIEPTLEEVKKRKVEEIKSTFEQIKTEGFTSSTGVKIDCGDENVNDFTQGFIFGKEKNKTDIDIIDYDNNKVSLTFTEYKDLVLELGDYKMSTIYKKNTLRELVNTATTIEEVEAVYWRTPIYDEDGLLIIGYNYNPILEV